MSLRAAFFTAFLFVFTAFFAANPSFAQISNTGTVTNIEIDDDEAVIGDILTVTVEGIVRSSTPYDEGVFGIIVSSPVVSTGERTANSVPVLSAGRALVNVTNAGGDIREGDFITTSENPGVGQKADDFGFVLGRALEPYSDNAEGQILVQISVVEFGRQEIGGAGGILGTIFGALGAGFTDAGNFPLVLRYISAALIAAVTFVIAAVSFVRFMSRGIEAIGRNPLARGVIIAGMVVNAIIVAFLAGTSPPTSPPEISSTLGTCLKTDSKLG